MRVAKVHVRGRFGITGLHSVSALRSARNHKFALVAGHFRQPVRRPDLWVVYLRVRPGGWRITYAATGFRAIEPKVRVPCDIWPPFAEPSC